MHIFFGDNRRISGGMLYEVLHFLSANTWEMNADGADSDTEGSVHSAF